MKTIKKPQDLTKYKKNELIELIENQMETQAIQEKKMTELNAKIDLLMEQLSVATQKKFGRSTEKVISEEQLMMIFNEAEVIITNKYVIEPTFEEITPKPYKRVKEKGKREEDLKDLPVKIIEHTLSAEVLEKTFGTKWRRLPDEVYKRLTFHPATFEVEEHHVGVYCGTDNQTIIKADRPVDLLRNSIVTPSLEAAILNYKYVNAMPLYRLEQEFLRQEIKISRQVMANWTIKCSERYFSLLYDRLQKELLKQKHLQADETPVMVSKDGRAAGSKSYMWVYRTGKMNTSPAIILYDYQRTRNSTHPETFLKGFKGTLVTDGYQVYHKLANENEDILVAGCWSHARRHFANIVKAYGKEKSKGTLAEDALKQIGLIYKLDNELLELSSEERAHKRKLLVSPMVDAFFAWVKKNQNAVPAQSETGKGFTYCINQEKYLRTFIDHPNVPLDNNATESAIRGFCIGKKNWVLIDTIDGAKASAVIYSIAETAKANNLKPYAYFKYLLEEIPKHMDDKNLSFLDRLLPWSDELPRECKKTNETELPQ